MVKRSRFDPAKLLAALVRLYPPHIRERFGAEMRDVIVDRYRRSTAGRRGWRKAACMTRAGAGIAGHAMLAWGERLLHFPTRALPLELRSIRRSLLRAPSFPMVIILVVAVTVAVATAVAGFYRGTLLDEPSYPDPDRLVFAWGSNVTSGQLRDVVSGPNFLDLRESTQTLDSVAAFHGASAVLKRDGPPEVLETFDVTVDFLKVLGVSPALGTDFDETHRSAGGSDAVIVSHAFWRDRLGSIPSVVGTTLPIDGRPHVIVGVTSPELEFLAPFDLLRSLREDVLRREDRTYYLYYLVGRLAAGATSKDATRELSSRLSRIAEEDDPRLTGWSVLVEPVREVSVEAVRPLLIAIGAGVLLLILAASMNLATLNLIRTLSRTRELFVRTALGAARSEIARIVAVETCILTAAGAIFGMLGGTVLIAWLGGIVPAWIPIPASAATIYALHGESDLFTLSAGAAAAVIMGTILLVPSLWHLRSCSWDRGNAAARTRSAGWRRGAQRLVEVELVLATLLVIFAGLLVRTAHHLLTVDPGVEPRGLLTMYVGQLQEPRPEARARYFLDVVREVESVAGVSRVGASDYVPFQGEDDFMGFRLPDRPPPPPGQGLREEWRRVSEGFFEAAGIDVRRGRVLELRDFEMPPSVAVVNEAFADKYWPQSDAVGSYLQVARQEYGLLEVVGVVENVPIRGPAVPPPPMFFVPLHGLPRDNMGLFVRVEGEPIDYVDRVREAVWSVDASQPIERVHTMTALVDDAVALPRLARSLVAQFAAVALLLAALGLFGIVGYSVRLRRAELGVRMALGATPHRIQRDLISEQTPSTLFAVAAGVALGIAAGYAGRALLHGISPDDPVTVTATAAVVLAAALFATYVPSRRAGRIDPSTSLRES